MLGCTSWFEVGNPVSINSSSVLKLSSLAVAVRTRSHVTEAMGAVWSVVRAIARVFSSTSKWAESGFSIPWGVSRLLDNAATSSGRSIISAGSTGWRDRPSATQLFDPWNMDHVEPVSECLFLQIAQAWVWYIPQGSITEKFEERFVVNCHN